VVATQNPIELEGTYPLPEAQLDRFLFKLEVRQPPVDAMVRILNATTGEATAELRPVLTSEELRSLQNLARQVICGTHLLKFVAELVQATHPDSADAAGRTRRFVRYGASVRAGQAIILGAKARALLAGRPSVAREDIDACLVSALRHRIVLAFEAEAERVTVPDLLVEWKQVAQKKSN
jgi:MoxR-like ATPase